MPDYPWTRMKHGRAWRARNRHIRGQSAVEYLGMLAVVVGGVLAVSALFKAAVPGVFNQVMGAAGGIQADSSEGSTEKAEDAAGGESTSGGWHIGQLGGKLVMQEGGATKGSNVAITQLANTAGAWKMLPKEKNVNRAPSTSVPSPW